MNKIIKFLEHSKKIKYANDLQIHEIINKIKLIDLATLSDKELGCRSKELAKKSAEGVPDEDILGEAYALVYESVKRVLNITPFDCQLVAAIHLNNKKIIEMQTGEGKTLAAVFPAYLNALSGKGVHILTHNDYLAKRDAAWMGPVFNILGLSVGYINQGMNTNQRMTAYSRDITYVTAKEAGFDYLRDSLSYDLGRLVHRPFNFAIIDEADSIMIDEARIPLVIAAGLDGKEGLLLFNKIYKIVGKLNKGQHYNTDEYLRNVFLTEQGIQVFEAAFNCGNLYKEENLNLLSIINSALHAQVLLHRDIDYIVKDGKLELVDEFTGRVVENRHWPDRLQTAVEVKEGLAAASKGRILSSVSIQNFINLYPKVSGMTGTALSSGEEFMNFYGLETVAVPQNRPCIRIDYPDCIYPDQESKNKALIKKIIEVNKTGRPILIGTCSIVESERIAGLLIENGIRCQVLNAKSDELEAKIIANAGALGAVTVSTNMAGRGTDIKLGGINEKDKNLVVALGGLYIIGTNRHESIRIDNQLRGRAGRQGDPGSSRFFICLEDSIFTKSNIKINVLKKYLKDYYEAQANSTKLTKQKKLTMLTKLTKLVLQLQRTIEGQNYDIRKTLWRYTDIIEQQRKIIFNYRADILREKSDLNILVSSEPEHYQLILNEIGTEKMKELEKDLSLYTIDQCWSEYLDYISYLRDGIHLVIVGGKNPLEEYIHNTITAFEELKENIKKDIVNSFRSIKIGKKGIEIGINGIKGPSATWTYLINDNPFEDDLGLMLASNSNIGFSAVAAGLPFISINLIIGLIYSRFFKKNKHIE